MGPLVPASPLYVNWNFTYACNFNCAHCYSRAERYPTELRGKDLDTVVDQIVEARPFTVGFGGGEPLIKRDVYGTVRTLREAGINTELTTNAWLLTEDASAQLVEAGLTELYVSLDHYIGERHDAFRRKDGSYAHVLDGLARAVGAGLTVMSISVKSAGSFGGTSPRGSAKSGTGWTKVRAWFESPSGVSFRQA